LLKVALTLHFVGAHASEGEPHSARVKPMSVSLRCSRATQGRVLQPVARASIVGSDRYRRFVVCDCRRPVPMVACFSRTLQANAHDFGSTDPAISNRLPGGDGSIDMAGLLEAASFPRTWRRKKTGHEKRPRQNGAVQAMQNAARDCRQAVDHADIHAAW